jgi:hypothetical protein
LTLAVRVCHEDDMARHRSESDPLCRQDLETFRRPRGAMSNGSAPRCWCRWWSQSSRPSTNR